MTTATFDKIWKKYGSLLWLCSVSSAVLAGENGRKFHTFFEEVIPVMN